MGVVAAPLAYSTNSAADQASPKPAFTLMNGSTPNSSTRISEFIGADVVGLKPVADGIRTRRPLIRIANRVAPLVSGEVNASREPPHSRTLHLQKGDGIRTEAADVVGRA